MKFAIQAIDADTIEIPCCTVEVISHDEIHVTVPTVFALQYFNGWLQMEGYEECSFKTAANGIIHVMN